MISELDETIRQILLKEGGFDTADVDVSFDLPNREWSGGISKPTLNCYLFDIRERRQLREEGWDLERRGTNGAARRRPPLHFELTYLITAWTRAVEDEHRLLWHVLRTMIRFPIMPTQHLQGMLAEYGWPIHTSIAQTEGVLKSPGEFWSALENHLKPSLSYVVTLALDTEAIPAGPPVLTTSLRMRPSAQQNGDGATESITTKPALYTRQVVIDEHDLTVTTDPQGRLNLEGTLRGDHEQPLPDTVITVEGHNHRVISDSEGRFRLNGLIPGRYTLAVKTDGRTLRHALIVRNPSHQMVIDVGDRPGSLSDTPTEGGTTTS
ncbi:MAG TPA: Pvc16 family protein [Herpetosiphonaceae bacterium]